jgi:glutamine synthetase
LALRAASHGTTQVVESLGFIARHGLWTDEQRRQAGELRRRIETEDLKLVRLTWADPHGAARAKAVTVPVFLAALEAGYNINVATATLDSANARTFASFTRGGGMGLPEMTGSPNLIIVPDPATFRVLPWAPGVGWVLCDEYFANGVPFHFSSRHLLRRTLGRLADKGVGCIVGLEVEWYLLRVADDRLGEENTGVPGMRGRPVKTAPVEPGFSYHSESNMDLMQPVLSALAEHFAAIGLPLRSIENEWGPGQLECTFAARPALEAADHALLFRTATRQICRRMGYFATFMCRPALRSYYSSGWHLHQSLLDRASGRNMFMPERERECLSPLGRAFLGGLLKHAGPCTAFATPTVNGYRRFRPNSLAPDRATWCYDNRGVMIRVLGGSSDPATRLENRIGEPAANPYLYMASQILSGLDGVDRALDPGPSADTPYEAKAEALPKSLREAVLALDDDPFFRESLGAGFVDYYVHIKNAEIERFQAEVSDWEHREYFEMF